MKFKPGDICLFDPNVSLDCLLITAVAKTGPIVKYDALSLKNKRYYVVKEDDLEKIGEVMAELGVDGVKAILTRKAILPAEDSLEVINGRARAKWEADNPSTLHRARWRLLAQAKPGDQLTIRSRWIGETVIFHYVLTKGKKYVFLAQDQFGKVLRYALESLVLPT